MATKLGERLVCRSCGAVHMVSPCYGTMHLADPNLTYEEYHDQYRLCMTCKGETKLVDVLNRKGV
jgi:hypothetical protein